MFTRILRRDLRKNRVITGIIAVFIAMAAMLAVSGAKTLAELMASMNGFFEKVELPDYMQMHAGETVDLTAVASFSESLDYVKDYQIAEMLTVDSSKLYLNGQSQAATVMDISLVKQNTGFDFLLDMDNERAAISKGGIGVPVYYKNSVALGDTVLVLGKSFVVESFIRDGQMNPSIIHSKRFLISDEDYAEMQDGFEKEYMLEFRLHDLSRLNDFEAAYGARALPANGPTITAGQFKLLNALTDGIIIAMLLFLSCFIILVAVLCLRFCIHASLEEEQRQIAQMKAIGIASAEIRRIYFVKYAAIAVLAAAVGFIAAVPVSQGMASGLYRSMGRAESGMLLPLVTALLVCLFVMLSCLLILRNINKTSALHGLQNAGKASRKLSLSRSILGVTVFSALNNIYGNPGRYLSLLMIFVMLLFAAIVPLNLSSTATDPSFANYMGIPECDMRLDLRNLSQFETAIADLEDDSAVGRFAPIVTTKLSVDYKGTVYNVHTEQGDFSIFPMNYMTGTAPVKDEIAFSWLLAEEMGLEPGDEVLLGNTALKVSGIYQDITNGGRTAKTDIAGENEDALWYIIYADYREGINIAQKAAAYVQAFPGARIVDTAGYTAQTFAETLNRITAVSLAALVTAILLSALITSLFVRLSAAREASQICFIAQIGIDASAIRREYILRILIVLLTAFFTAFVLSISLGESILNTVWGMLGAPKVLLKANIVQAYILLPLAIGVSVTAAAFFAFKINDKRRS